MSYIVSSPQIPKHLAALRTLRHLVIAAIIALLLFVCMPVSGDALIMEEAGHFSGADYHELLASGPLCSIVICPANESLLEVGSGTVWIVQQNGSPREVV